MPQAILPIIAIAGLGLSAYGMSEQRRAASRSADAQAQIAGQEMQAEKVRQRAMELDAHRKQIEAIRNQQRGNALALSGATNQGAQLGSGVQGGYGQVGGQTSTNLLGLSQNLSLGNQMFDINSQIGQQRMYMAQAGGDAASGAGWSSLGGSLMSSAQGLQRLSGGFGSPYGNSYGSSGYGNLGSGSSRNYIS